MCIVSLTLTHKGYSSDILFQFKHQERLVAEEEHHCHFTCTTCTNYTDRVSWLEFTVPYIGMWNLKNQPRSKFDRSSGLFLFVDNITIWSCMQASKPDLFFFLFFFCFFFCEFDSYNHTTMHESIYTLNLTTFFPQIWCIEVLQ